MQLQIGCKYNFINFFYKLTTSSNIFSTGVQRIISGTMSLIGKTSQGVYNIKYTLPVNYDTTLHVLDTDYENFAVVWACSGISPFGHTESAWVMTRERLPPGPIIQRAYGVLDKFKISRTFFIETDQKDCETLPPPIQAADPTQSPDKINLQNAIEIEAENNEQVIEV